MASLESLRRNLDRTRDLKTVVKTMKSIAAVNVRHYERAVGSVNEYNQTVELGLRALLFDKAVPIEVREGASSQTLGVLVFGSDQGMCGPFNERIVSFLQEHLLKDAGGRIGAALAVGERVVPYLKDAGLPVEGPINLPGAPDSVTWSVQEILLIVDEWRRSGKADRVEIFHNHPESGAAYTSQRQTLIPLDPRWLREIRESPWPGRSLPFHTMDFVDLFPALVRQSLLVRVYRAFVESLAAENASRFASMQSAEDNLEERIGELEASYRRQRQSMISEELFDVIAGFEALSEGKGVR